MTLAKDVLIDVQDQYDEALDATTTSSYVNTLTINSIGVSNSTITIHNNGLGDLDYELLATVRNPTDIVAPTGTDDDDEGWIELVAEVQLAADAEIDEIIVVNRYTQIVVRTKHTTLATEVDILHRGTYV